MSIIDFGCCHPIYMKHRPWCVLWHHYFDEAVCVKDSFRSEETARKCCDGMNKALGRVLFWVEYAPATGKYRERVRLEEAMKILAGG